MKMAREIYGEMSGPV
jgi:hypothetical protein